MAEILLSNGRCAAAVDPQRGGRVTSFKLNRPSSVEWVGSHHLQTWLKHGTDRDPGAGALHLLYHDFTHRTFDIASSTKTEARLFVEAHGVRFERRFALDDSPESAPTLTIEATVTNVGAPETNFQIEQFFNWSFGASSDRRRVVTVLLGGRTVGEARHVHLPPYGDVFVRPYDATGAAVMALCDLEHEQTLLQEASEDWANFTVYQMAGANWRGPYSAERRLARGEKLSTKLRLTIVEGAAAVDRVDEGRATGLVAERAVFFADEAVTLAASLARTDGPPIGRCRCVVNAAGRNVAEFDLASTGASYTGSTRRIELPAGSLGAGEARITATFDHATAQPDSTAEIRVLDPRTPARLIEPVAKAAFPVRAIHLILSQQETRALTADALKWLAEHVLAPCGFTHAIWECNSALRLRSHPELAGTHPIDPDGLRDVSRFCRSVGVEPIPQQNFYGHQHETNLVKVYPELAEIPGDVSVYCPSHPKVRQIAADIARELIDIFEPKFVHIGHDEIQFRGGRQTVGVCERCRTRPPHQVFADDVNALDAVIRAAGARTVLWGDHLIPPQYDGNNVNGVLGEVYRAVDLIPRDAVICDWHYFPSEDYRSNEFFLGKGFEVWNAVWFLPSNTQQFAQHGKRAGANGMIFTTWTRPDLGSMPVEAMLHAAQCFQDPDSVDDPDLGRRITTSAHRLWREWQRWNDRS